MKNHLKDNFGAIADAIEKVALEKAHHTMPKAIKKLQQLSGLLFAANRADMGGDVDEMQEKLTAMLKKLNAETESA